MHGCDLCCRGYRVQMIEVDGSREAGAGRGVQTEALTSIWNTRLSGTHVYLEHTSILFVPAHGSWLAAVGFTQSGICQF